MENKIIFRTKLNSSNDYDKFEMLDSATNLSESDILTVQKYAEVFYNSTNSTYEDRLELSIGHVIIKGSNHPTAHRRKMIEGFIEVEEVIEQVPEPPKDDKRAKELFINFLKELLKHRPIADEEKIVAKQVEILIEKLVGDDIHINFQDLLYHNLQFLSEYVFKENGAMIGVISSIKSTKISKTM